jgi:hypothetical protein
MQRIKHHFIPHKVNTHHAPVLHRKRHITYSLFAIAIKLLVVFIAILIPLEVFVTPDALDAQRAAIIEETNKIRIKLGEEALDQNVQLHDSASLKAMDMKQFSYFGHESPSGDRVGDIVKMSGYEFLYAGENLAIGYGTADHVVEAWRKSATHYANLVYPFFVDIGIGASVGVKDGVPVPYFVQHFGTPKSANSGLPVDTRHTGADASAQILPQSRVFWKDVPGGIRISPQVFVEGNISRLTLTGFESLIVLDYNGSMYTTSTLLRTSPRELFDPTLPVSVEIITTDGEIIESLIPWQDPPLLQPTWLDRYHMAVAYLRDVAPLIIISRTVFVIGILLFGAGLIAHMAWSVHEKKHRITFEAMLTIGLLILLFFI